MSGSLDEFAVGGDHGGRPAVTLHDDLVEHGRGGGVQAVRRRSSTSADVREVDDIGLLPVAPDAAEGLDRLVDAAYEKGSVAVSSNLLLHCAHLCAITGDSVRLAQVRRGKG